MLIEIVPVHFIDNAKCMLFLIFKIEVQREFWIKESCTDYVFGIVIFLTLTPTPNENLLCV